MSYKSPEDTSTPRWVKVFGVIAALVVVLLIVLLVFGGGGHGPQRHGSSPAVAVPMPR